MGFLCTVSWDKVGQRSGFFLLHSELGRRSGVSVHSELGQNGTWSDKKVGFLCRVNWDKLGQSGVSLHSLLGQSGTKKWGLCAQ